MSHARHRSGISHKKRDGQKTIPLFYLLQTES